MRTVVLTNVTSSSIFGGSIGTDSGEAASDYLYGEEGQELVGDAELVLAVFGNKVYVVRAPEGVRVEALRRRVPGDPWIESPGTPEGYREYLEAQRHG